MRAFIVKDESIEEFMFKISEEWGPRDGIFWIPDDEIPDETTLEVFLREGRVERRRHFELVSGTVFQATKGSLGWDIYAAGHHAVPAGGTRAIKTGIRSVMSPDLFAEIAGRSSLALKGIDVMGGQIDSDFAHEWQVILCNHGAESFRVNDGDRIAQFKIKVKEEVSLKGNFLVGDLRRKGGFGSTGS